MVPQRQMFPAMAASISSSLGDVFSVSRAAALMIWPGWQKPHCGTWASIQAFCTLWPPSKLSIVVMLWPSRSPMAITQDRTA